MSVGLRAAWRSPRQSSSHQPSRGRGASGGWLEGPHRQLEEPPPCPITTAAAPPAARRARSPPSSPWSPIPAALAVSGLVVAQSSYSAYSATTVNPTSNWATGTVALTDDDNNTAAFTASNLKPGSTGTRCIVVSSTGSLPSSVKLYGTGAATTKALASDINLTITQGTGGSFGSCTGYTPLTTGSSVYSGTLAGFGSHRHRLHQRGRHAGTPPASPPAPPPRPAPTSSPTASRPRPRTTPRAAPRPSASPGRRRTADPQHPGERGRPRAQGHARRRRAWPSRSAGPGRQPIRSPASTRAVTEFSGGASGQSQASS